MMAEADKSIEDQIGQVQKIQEIGKKTLPPPNNKKKGGPVSTSTKQITGYTTIKGIQSETSHPEHEWPEFSVKELVENAYDDLQDHYPVKTNNKETRKIAVFAKIELIPEVIASIPPPTQFAPAKVITHIIRIRVRNSNVNNYSVFEDLEAIFDYDNWYSTKRNQFRMTTGALGDFLKRVPGMGYASWTADYNPEDSFEDKQWDQPVIFRFNGQERKVFVIIEHGKKIYPDFKEPTKYDTPGFTEVEIALPLPTYWNSHFHVLLNQLEKYCRMARLSKSKTDISFNVEGV